MYFACKTDVNHLQAKGELWPRDSKVTKDIIDWNHHLLLSKGRARGLTETISLWTS